MALYPFHFLKNFWKIIRNNKKFIKILLIFFFKYYFSLWIFYFVLFDLWISAKFYFDLLWTYSILVFVKISIFIIELLNSVLVSTLRKKSFTNTIWKSSRWKITLFFLQIVTNKPHISFKNEGKNVNRKTLFSNSEVLLRRFQSYKIVDSVALPREPKLKVI